MSSSSKATESDSEMNEAVRDNLGNLQPLAVTGYHPDDPNPGADALAVLRRLLNRYILITFRGDSRLPVSWDELNRAHDALRDHWAYHAT